MDIVPIVAVGIAGAALASLLRVPNGALLGPIAAVAALHAASNLAPPGLGPVTIAGQLLIGTAVGVGVRTETLRAFRAVIVPGLLAVGGMLVSGAIVAVILLNFTDLPRSAALLGAMPGGATEMAATAIGLGADGAAVVAVHLTRSVVILALLPLAMHPLVTLITPRSAPPSGRDRPTEQQ